VEVVTEPAAPGPEPTRPWWRYAARLAWMAIQLILVLCLGQRGVLFFYQGF
jgi:hypothetical protein